MRLQWPRFSLKPEPDRAQDPCTARIGSTGDTIMMTTELGFPQNMKVNIIHSSVLTELKLNLGHSEHKQGNVLENAMKYAMLYAMDKIKYEIMKVTIASKLPVSYRPALGRVGLWIELEMDWPPRPIHCYASGKQPASN
ncbi:hypothetical protein TIFTF001_035692 [Ficus carica]|uniref:Uncharacterized protein n=1 Tax=Ficus carica TaxID=3494 RepID=A0AA88E219_FICCA|nr:hypothetical protein TIFTF001_035692 [Ficus carica]